MGAFQIVVFDPSLRGRSPKQSRRKIAITQFSGLLHRFAVRNDGCDNLKCTQQVQAFALLST
jgi:hypothetical protein